jgi:hypothetical protein
MLTNSESDLYPFALVVPLGLQKCPLHRHPIRALATSSAGCVGWFFESVIGRILGSGLFWNWCLFLHLALYKKKEKKEREELPWRQH